MSFSKPLINPPPGVYLKTLGYSSTSVGMVRDSNQDSHMMDSGLGLFIVADGMGGRAGGEIASQLAIETISSVFSANLSALVTRDMPARRALMGQIINAAALKIYERALEMPEYRGMGTTCTVLWVPTAETVHEGVGSDELVQALSCTALVAHVGDSRCYLLRSGLLYRVTDDHSLVNEKIKAGLLKKGDPMVSQMKNVITRCVGYQEEEEIDTFVVPICHGDRFLICSDGLTNKVEDVEISKQLGQEHLSEVPENLVTLSNTRGGEDNITVVVVEVQVVGNHMQDEFR